MKNHNYIILVVSLCLSSSHTRADVITEWNNMALQTFAQQGSLATPPENTRALAMTFAAAFDAVNSISRDYNPYLSYYDPTGSASAEAAAAQAAHDVMTSLYGSNSTFATNYNNLLSTQLAGISDGGDKTRGIALGATAAAGMISARASDGSAASTTYSPQPSGTPGAWQPSGAGVFVKSEWAYVTPFTMSSGDQFRPAAPPSLNSQAYTDAFNQVKTLGSSTGSTRTTDQTQIAFFWKDGPGTASPPGHWNQIAQIISASQGLTMQQNARLFALLNLAEADAGIAAWDAKRAYDFWRPDMAIAQAGIDGNSDTIADAAWTPLIPTPSFPSYVSGHSTFSGAGAAVLAAYFGSDNIAFTSSTQSTDLPAGTTRDFTSISQAAYEAGMSRIYGGIHYDFDNVAGLDLGAQIGGNTYNNFLQPVPEPGGAILMGVAGALALLRRTRKN